MMKLVVFLVLSISLKSYAQTFNVRHDLHEIGKPQTPWGIEATPSTAGTDYIVIQGTSFADTIDPSINFWGIGLTKVDGISGEKIWDKSYGIPWVWMDAGWANCCDALPGGGVVMSGSRLDTVPSLRPHLFVFDSAGDTIFTRILGEPGQYWYGFQVKHTQDGGFIIVGQTAAGGSDDGLAIKVDAFGNEEWSRTYGQPSTIVDGLVTVIQLPDGDYVAGGTNYPSLTVSRWWIQRMDGLGEVVWSRYYTASPMGNATAQLELLADGTILMASSWQYDIAADHLRAYLAKIDPDNGDIIWENQYGAIGYGNSFFSAKESANGDIIACGASGEFEQSQGVLLRTSSVGDSLWMFKYFFEDEIMAQGIGRFRDVLPTPDGGFIATGTTYWPLGQQYPEGYSQDAWVVKVDALGCIVPGCNTTGIRDQAIDLRHVINVWPNPVTAGHQLTVAVDLPLDIARQTVEMSMVSADDRIVFRRPLPMTSAQPFSITIPDVASGVYFFHVFSGEKWYTGSKIVVE